MNNIVTQRFAEVHKALKEQNKVKSNRQFAISLDYAPQSMDLMLKGKRDVTIELIRKFASRYHVNTNFLFTGEGDMFSTKGQDSVPCQEVEDRIVYVPVSAKAGYGDQFNDPVYMEDLPRFSLPDPKFKHGIHRCFDVEGDSMEPTLFRGDKVVCNQMEQQYWSNSVRDNFVYVVVTNGDVLVKRVVNKIRENGVIELFSDNGYYPPRVVDIRDVREIWHVEVKISPFMPSPNHQRNALHEEIKHLKDTLSYLCEESKSVNKGIEHMVKMSRKTTHYS